MYYDEHGQEKNNVGVSLNNSMGGFDAVIGNPPWERVQVSDDDFFRPIYFHETGKSWSSLSKSAKEKFKSKVLTNEEMKYRYTESKNHVKALREYFRKKYTAQGGGTSEMFKLFIERSLCLLSKKSSFGMNLPTAIYSDSQCADLRKIMFEHTSIQHILSFINTKAIFKDIHRQFNFCVIILHSCSPTIKFGLSYKLTNLAEINKKPLLDLSVDLIKQISGDSMTVLEANYQDYKIIKKMQMFPTLNSKQWKFTVTREFDMTIDRDLFQPRKSKSSLPLYEGKTITHFNIDGPIRYYVELNKGKKRLCGRDSHKINNFLKKLNLRDNSKFSLDCTYHRLAWRIISNPIDYRTVYATILPHNVFHGNSLWSVRPKILSNSGQYIKQHADQELGYMCGIFNSLPFDWYIRPMVRLNVTKTIMIKMPIPVFDSSNFHHINISKLAWGIICRNSQYSDLKQKLAITTFDTQEKITLAEAQISAHAAMIYNLDVTDLKYICKQFRVFSIKRPNFIQEVLNSYNVLTRKNA